MLRVPHVLVCRALFGYRMEMVSDPWADVQHAPTTYTLTSCFGPKEDVLMFRCAHQTQNLQGWGASACFSAGVLLICLPSLYTTA
jgi:hypothetical protein